MDSCIDWSALETLPAATWMDQLGHIEHGLLVHASADALRSLLLPLWAAAHPNNRQPARAADAAIAYVDRPSENGKRHALAIAKACSHERERTFGYEHRIAEAARALIWAATRSSPAAKRDALAEALGKIEEELVTRDAVAGVYDREREHRARLIRALRSRLDERSR
jgi:hypothetical protein